MSNTKTIPHPKAKREDSELIRDLITLAERKSGKRALVKSSTYDAPSDPEIKVRSWKMDEHKYYDVPSPFPSLVRGLFTVDLPLSGQEKQYRIVARGYDKFFNIGEVPWTTWDALEHHTAAPYVLSLKSNGCIIFVGALTPTKIIVTSKHSLGNTGDKESHAAVGERWLRKYLEEKCRTEEDLATVLWDNNWTLCAELCDDSFEEHVLTIPAELTGLHLHGINESTKAFKTLCQDIVDAFAEEWGFIKTLSTTVDTITEVRKFTTEVSEIGHWKGQAVEGFVVRTHVTEPPADKETHKSKSPYFPGSTFFFKVKFDEPYMMYRDWREVTKKLLSLTGPLSPSALPKSKMKRPETKLYVRWVIDEIKRDRKQFANYNKGHGIIATRERFLEWMKTNGKSTTSVEPGAASIAPDSSASKQFGKTIIVPVAIPGCGKTTVAVALAHIFGWGHTQSDDVRAKKSAPVFIKNVRQLLSRHDVVIADKNNHLVQHRQQLRDLSREFVPPARLVGLDWSWNIAAKPHATIQRICGERVLLRGEKHQTLHGNAATKSHEHVITMFITNTEELTESEVDASVDMEIEETIEQSIRRAVEGCAKILNIEMPSEEKIQDGIDKALGYTPVVSNVKDKGKGKEPKPSKSTAPKGKPRYFGLVPDIQLEKTCDDVVGDDPFWRKLKADKRVITNPHVTIVHQKNLPDSQALWDRCMELQTLVFEVILGHLVWNDRIMAATVEGVRVKAGSGDDEQKGAKFVKELPDEVREGLHVTVGTRDAKVVPFEAKDLVRRWRKGDTDANIVKSKSLNGLVITGTIKGLFA